MIKRGYSKLNQFVKDCFKEKKLSIKREIDKLAIELNTTYTNLRYQIYGWYPLTQELAEKLSKMIDVPVEELFKLSYEPENSIDYHVNCVNPKAIRRVMGIWQ